MKTETLVLNGTTPGRTHSLVVHRFGSGLPGPKMYVQAGLHADEPPGLLVTQVLRERLSALEQAGQLRGEFVLVPAANPIGLGQSINGQPFGRFALSDGINFNRGFAHLTYGALARLDAAQSLGDDPKTNHEAVRGALIAECAQLPEVTEVQHLRKLLMQLALPCDTVLDLHCDGESVLHAYTGTPLAAAAQPLAELLGAQALLTAEDSGDHPYDEAMSRPWWEIQRAKPNTPIGEGALSVTIELRGEADVSDALARADAQAILAFAALRGVLELPGAEKTAAHPAVEATPLAAVEPLTAPISGVVVFAKKPGDWIEPGDEVARIVEPMTGANASVCATRAGLMYARIAQRTIVAGRRIGKIAGRDPFRTGTLLSP
jgi:uncharacterized protein